MIFDLGTLGDITLISLALAVVALLVTLLAFYLTRRQMSDLKSINKSIDAYAVVQEFSQRSKKVEERLVDQKVRLEILELRQQKSGGVYVAPAQHREMPVHAEVRVAEEIAPVLEPLQTDQWAVAPTSSELVRSEIEALHVVFESGSGGASAKQIQSRIGRSREHTARMMNSLFKQGLVERNAQARPFTYTLTEKGKNAL